MPDEDNADSVEAQPAQVAVLKSVSSKLTVIIVVQVILALALAGVLSATWRMQGDVAKMAVLTEKQLSETPAP